MKKAGQMIASDGQAIAVQFQISYIADEIMNGVVFGDVQHFDAVVTRQPMKLRTEEGQMIEMLVTSLQYNYASFVGKKMPREDRA